MPGDMYAMVASDLVDGGVLAVLVIVDVVLVFALPGSFEVVLVFVFVVLGVLVGFSGVVTRDDKGVGPQCRGCWRVPALRPSAMKEIVV